MLVWLMPLGMLGFCLYEYDTDRRNRDAGNSLTIELRSTRRFKFALFPVAIVSVGGFAALVCSPPSALVFPLEYSVPSVRLAAIAFAVGFATIPVLKTIKLPKWLTFGVEDLDLSARKKITFFTILRVWWNS